MNRPRITVHDTLATKCYPLIIIDISNYLYWMSLNQMLGVLLEMLIRCVMLDIFSSFEFTLQKYKSTITPCFKH